MKKYLVTIFFIFITSCAFVPPVYNIHVYQKGLSGSIEGKLFVVSENYVEGKASAHAEAVL